MKINTFLLINLPITALLAYFAPIYVLFHVMSILVVTDCITAIAKVFKKNPSKNKTWWGRFKDKFKLIESNKLRRTAIKFVLYNVFIGLVYAVAKNIVPNAAIECARGAFGLLAIVELKSVCENMSYITGNKAFLSFFSLFQNKVTDKINETIKDNSKEEISR